MSFDLALFRECPMHGTHSDAARRMSEHVSMHFAAIGFDAVGKYVAIRLQDGASDHVLYDTKRDAVRHTDEFRHAYVRIQRDTMSPCEAQILLAFHRQAYDNGFRLADPDSKTGGRDHLLSTRLEERKRVLATLRMGR